MGHHLKGDVLVLIQKPFCLADADVQVIIGEFVGNVKPQRAKLSSLRNNSMKQAERQEQRLKVCHLQTEEEQNK